MKKLWLLLFVSNLAWGAYSPSVFVADPTTPTQRAAVSAGGALKVDNSGVTQPVSAASLPLPAGAATSALQTTISGQLPAALDGSGFMKVHEQGTAAVTTSGVSAANHARNDYTITNVTTTAYVQLIASTSAVTDSVEIFDSSGQTLVLATGAAASEVDQIYITPGGNGRVPLRIAAGTRVSIKAVSGTASAGEIDLNLYQ